MGVPHVVELGLDQPDHGHIDEIQDMMHRFPSPIGLPPALPGSPTLPPSGSVTPAPTVPPSPTDSPAEDEAETEASTPPARASTYVLSSPPMTPCARGQRLSIAPESDSRSSYDSPPRSPSHLPHLSQTDFHSQVRQSLDDLLVTPTSGGGDTPRRVFPSNSSSSTPYSFTTGTGQHTPSSHGAVEDEDQIHHSGHKGHLVLGSPLRDRHDLTRVSPHTHMHATTPSSTTAGTGTSPPSTNRAASGPRSRTPCARPGLAESHTKPKTKATTEAVASMRGFKPSNQTGQTSTYPRLDRSASEEDANLGSRPPLRATQSQPHLLDTLSCDDEDDDTLGVLGLPHSGAPLRPRHGNDALPSTSIAWGGSAARKYESSKRNAFWSSSEFLDEDVAGWLNYLNNTAARHTVENVRMPTSVVAFPDMTVDTSIYSRRASDAGLSAQSARVPPVAPPRLTVGIPTCGPTPPTSASASGSGSTPALTESYNRDWRRDLSLSRGACLSPSQTSLSSASSSTGTGAGGGAGPTGERTRVLPPQAPPPKRPLPLLPDPPTRVPSSLLVNDENKPIHAMLSTLKGNATPTATILQRRASSRRPSGATVGLAQQRRESTRTEKDTRGGSGGGSSGRAAATAGISGAGATSGATGSLGRARASLGVDTAPTYPYAAYSFAATTTDLSLSPLRGRAASTLSLGLASPTASQASASTPNFGSALGHGNPSAHAHSPRHGHMVSNRGHAVSSSGAGAGAGGGARQNRQSRQSGHKRSSTPSKYEQETWNFTPRSPETPVRNLNLHLGQSHARTQRLSGMPSRMSTAKRRFASVTFWGDHGQGNGRERERNQEQQSERERLKKEKKERRSSGYFDSKSEFAFGEGRAKSFMRRLAAWAR